MLQISAFGPLVFLQCFFFEAIGFGTSWCKMTKNVENQHDVVSMVPNLGGEWSWFQHVNKTDLNILAKTMQDAKGENHVTIVMILPTFSTLRHLWCSHHSAFVKSLPIFFFHSRLQKWQPTGRDRQHVLFSLCSARAGVLWCFSCTVLAGGLGHLTSSRKFPGRMAREGCCSFFFTTQNFNAWMFETRDTVVWQLLWIRCRFFFSDSTWYSNVQIFSTWFAITEPQQFHLRVFLEGHNH